jgi:signal transduction histidine kinase
MLYEFITLNRDALIARCRAKVAARSIPPLTAAEIDHGVPLFVDQLVEELRSGVSAHVEINRSALQHGRDLFLQGFNVSQVVHGYGDICQAITALAVETSAPISTDEFRTLNRCLDDAIAGAVTEFGLHRNQSAIAGETARGSARAGYLAHELRNLMNTAIIAFEVLKTGNVGVAGSTGAVLHRSLLGARTLVGRSLAEIRLTQGIQNKETLLVTDLIQEVAPAARLLADARGLTFTVLPVEEGLAVDADRQVLGAVVMNLLENAFKFTRPQSTVTLRVGAGSERVLIEVHDECGGLPDGNPDELFRPFEQRGADRVGLGLGLAFSRWGVEANNGRIYARNMAGKGCVFIVDLPRFSVPVVTQ